MVNALDFLSESWSLYRVVLFPQTRNFTPYCLYPPSCIKVGTGEKPLGVHSAKDWHSFWGGGGVASSWFILLAA